MFSLGITLSKSNKYPKSNK
uniref:Uncharacterized protein n=1 Tax=Arundo donax TaxID=35708 RepID=A0A0A8ZSX9_ARUDO